MVVDRRWRPGSFDDKEVDFAFRTAFDGLARNEADALQNPSGQNMRATWGSATVTGSLTGIATDLATVAQVIASIDSSAAINEIVTVALGDEGQISLFVWKPTAAGDTTPIASTTARTVRWFAAGT